MKILVTGGAGFLGSHLVDRLLGDPAVDRVIVIDNLYTGSLRNLVDRSEEIDRGRLVILQRDVVDEFHVDCDRIYHLASPAAPIHYVRAGARTLETIFSGTRNALRLAREINARILIGSTSEIYGDPAVHPQPETYEGRVWPAVQRSVYDEGKRVGETLAGLYWREYDVDCRIARIFNTYGPRMAHGDGRVIPAFFDAARQGRPIEIHGDGNQTRSFCYVSDLISGLMQLMEAGRAAVEEIGECHRLSQPPIFNLGNPGEVTMRDLAREVIRLVGRRLEIRFDLPHPVGNDPGRRCPDITRAVRLGIEPRVSLTEGLWQTWSWWLASDRIGRPVLSEERADPEGGVGVV